MTSSIYHFFLDLVSKRGYFLQEHDLETFQYDSELIADYSRGRFPDVILKTNNDDPYFPGGEFIEFKNTNSYSIASFNSTIPSGRKTFGTLAIRRKQSLRSKGHGSNDDDTRNVFYLIRGRDPQAKPFPISKVCLVHGSFFETISKAELIRKAFQLVLNDFSNINIEKVDLTQPPKQQDFAQSRSVDSAAVKVRFRIMAEVETKANVLRQAHFPQIGDNTLSFMLPLGPIDFNNTLSALVAPKEFPLDLPPIRLLGRAIENYKSATIWEELAIGVLKHPINESNWFIAQANFNIYESVSRP